MDELDANLDRLRRAIDLAVAASHLGEVKRDSAGHRPQIPQSDVLSAAEADQVRGGLETPHSWTDVLRRWLGR